MLRGGTDDEGMIHADAVHRTGHRFRCARPHSVRAATGLRRAVYGGLMEFSILVLTMGPLYEMWVLRPTPSRERLTPGRLAPSPTGPVCVMMLR